MDNFLNTKDFVYYLFFNNRKLSIIVEKWNMILEVENCFSCPFGIENEVDVDIPRITGGDIVE